jgi:hypothetical protein
MQIWSDKGPFGAEILFSTSYETFPYKDPGSKGVIAIGSGIRDLRVTIGSLTIGRRENSPSLFDFVKSLDSAV